MQTLSVPRSEQFSENLVSSWKTVSFKQQTMSKDKYQYHSIFSCQMEGIVFFISFENYCGIIILGYFPVLAGEYLVT